MSRARTLLALFALYGCAGEAATQEAAAAAGTDARARAAAGSASLESAIARAGATAGGPVWVAWEVPSTTRHRICCFDRQFAPGTCMLEGENRGWGSSGDGPPGSGRLQVLVRWAGGRAGRVASVDATCPVDAGELAIVRLPDVPVEESVEWLAALATREDRVDGVEGEPVAALAYHAGPAATQALQRLAGEENPFDLREKALFWIGQARGEEGARFLAGVVRGDDDPDIREKAIFSLSQNESPLSEQALVEAARRDSDAEVRGQALFWLAQTKEGAAPVLLAALDEDPSGKVREQAIFAMSQLRDEGVPLLVRVARDRKRDPELRRQALFWLGQSKDPRALEFLEEILR